MFPWRKRNEGFEWRDYVRTTVLARRRRRQERVVAARNAALEGVREAGRRGARASLKGIDRAKQGIGAMASHAFRSLQGASHRVSQVWGDHGKPAAERALSNARQRFREHVAPIARRGRAALKPAAEGAIAALDRSEIANPLGVLGAAATVAALIRILVVGFDAVAVIAAVFGLAALVAGAVRHLRRSATGPLPQRLRAYEARHRLADWMPSGSLWGNHRWVAVWAAAVFLIVGIGLWPLLRGAGQQVQGRATAVSGDMLQIAGSILRLDGVEAPDRDQECVRPDNRPWRCGQSAAQALSRLVRGRQVACAMTGRDADGTMRGRCTVGGRDLGADLVRQGHVFAAAGLIRRYGGEEKSARAASDGLWLGTAERPADYRAKRWAEATRTAPNGCPIKGQLTAEGRVYVLPWGRAYNRVKLREAKGERWFCSEAEAQAAGWKPQRL